MSKPKRVLFVCLGNIVRSPLAEHLFRKMAAERGLDGAFEADSAGTSIYHIGEPPDPRMRETAAKRGLTYAGRARHLEPEDLDLFDLILAMDRSNLRHIRELADDYGTKAKIRLLRDFDPQPGHEPDVPDPYYGGMAGFDHTYDIVSRSVEALLDELVQAEA